MIAYWAVERLVDDKSSIVMAIRAHNVLKSHEL
jgi:hypothetical protein